jgi:hypothetical protein
MKKREFLVPLATLIAALEVNNAQATLESQKTIVSNENKPIVLSIKGEANNPFTFILQKSEDVIKTADHYSHSSHSSHGSHRSHSSGY